MSSSTHAVASLALALLLHLANGHSLLGYPRPMSSRECRLGGTLPGPILTCPGPCDTRPFFRNLDIKGPEAPTAVWGRGQQVTIKYQRNNHGPGGFIRLSIVPISRTMNKETHERNAFHYGCWGGNTVLARKDQARRDDTGFSLIGNDGKHHDINLPIAYYSVNVTIPKVIPNGRYTLGWAWFGGVGGTIENNKPSAPYSNGFFSDVWSCAFIEIKGGAPLAKGSKPVFQADLKRHWGNACWSANNEPGVCKYGPCKKPKASLQRPKAFSNGKVPEPLNPYMFRSPSSCSELGRKFGVPCVPGPVPSPISPERVAREAILEVLKLQG